MISRMARTTLLLAAACWPVFVSAEAGFAGTQLCAECHAEQHAAWQGSHHDLAMQEATDATVLGDFNEAEITVGNVTSRFFRRDGQFLVRTDGADGKPADFVIRYTFGADPLQQYLVEFPDGRLQALGLAWDARAQEQGGQRWFHLYPDQAVDHAHPLHWTGPEQNANYQCIDCHVTGYRKNYDPAADRFDSSWAEIDVACEACHGPGARHVAWAKGAETLAEGDVSLGLAVLLRDRKGVSWQIDPATGIARRSEPPAASTELEVCAGCHARRGALRDGKAGQARFLDYHLPAFLTEPLYYPDGQIREEVYVWGSFLQSRMHAAGVSCSDCHDPHSNRLRAPGSQVCATCHAPAKFAATAHHGHPADSAGADCLACHMPETTYMVVDPRRDHSLRVPRPDQAAAPGTPSACGRCHADRDETWAAGAFARLFPDAGDPYPSWGRAFESARQGLPQAEVALMAVANREGTPDLARATAVLELGGYLSPLSAPVLRAALDDASPLVRIAALRALEQLPIENRWMAAEPLLADPLLAVRAEAGRVLAATPRAYLEPQQADALEAAVGDYVATQDYNAERAESRVNLGNLYLRLGEAERAEAYYREAIRRDATFTPAYVNLSQLYRELGGAAEARAILQQGLERQPGAADLHHALGLLLAGGGDLPQALAELEQASLLDPTSARYAYVWGVALNSAGRAPEALRVLEQAWQRHPMDRDLLLALATINRDAGDREAALGWAERLLERNPADRDATALKQELLSKPD